MPGLLPIPIVLWVGGAAVLGSPSTGIAMVKLSSGE